MATRVIVSVYHQSETPLSCTVVLPLPSFNSLSLSLSLHCGTIFPFSYFFPCLVYVHVWRSVARRKGRISPTVVFHIIYNLRLARCPPPLPAITRSGSANARACRQIGGNRGRRNLSRLVTTLSDVVVQGSDIRMCPLEDGGKYDCVTIL